MFQRVMHLVHEDLIVVVNLDDINVLTETFEETLASLTRFCEFGLELKPRKFCRFQWEADFLRHQVYADGVHVTNNHFKDMLEWTWKDSWVLWIIIGNLFRAWQDELLQCISWPGPVLSGTGWRNIREHLRTQRKLWPRHQSWVFQMLENFLSLAQMHQILAFGWNWVKCEKVRSMWSHMLVRLWTQDSRNILQHPSLLPLFLVQTVCCIDGFTGKPQEERERGRIVFTLISINWSWKRREHHGGGMRIGTRNPEGQHKGLQSLGKEISPEDTSTGENSESGGSETCTIWGRGVPNCVGEHGTENHCSLMDHQNWCVEWEICCLTEECFLKESTKTTSMEDVSTGVLEKKNI